MSSTTITPNLKDPSTFMQRPTSAKTPDVSHILTSLFGELYTKDVLSADVIKNLTISSDVDDQYHKRYVQKLKEAQMIKENRLQEYAMLEKHILEARAKALAFEEREDEKRKKICDEPDEFGVPPDDTLLKDHGLLVPSDYYYKTKAPFVPMPKDDEPKSHLRDTISSKRRTRKKPLDVLPPITSSRVPNINDIEEFHKSGSELSDEVNAISSNDEEEPEKEEKKPKPFWKETLRQEERMQDREILKKLESRTKFLPNPRLDAARIAQTNENPETIFEVSPKYILFNKYVTGKVYESSFEVRNISTTAHQMRAIPPKTQYFSLSLGQYPQGQSVIAPGLAAIYNVRFAPDSLCSYEDEIIVECSNGSRLLVPIIAKRESPNLSIGPIINCGQSLVGQIKVCRFVIQNDGGDGRFVIFPKSTWPVSTFKTNISTSTLSLYPFEIQPSIFELHKGDVFILEVIFKPADVRRYEQDIVITCDNCTTIEFKLVGEGELAEIEYNELEDDVAEAAEQSLIAIDDYKDRLSNKILRFPSLNPNVYTRKRFQIRNKSASPVDYTWMIFKPILEDNLFSEPNSTKNQNYIVDKDSFFTISAKQGTLDRNEVKVFEVMFSPTKVGSYSNVAHLILHGIPEINKQLMLDTTNEIHKSTLTKEDVSTSDYVSKVLELRGECEPFQFTLDPPAIFVPGSTYMQTTTRKAFRLINMSICPINFTWKQIVEPHLIQVEPSYGEIAPKSYALMDVLITGVKPGRIIEDIGCFVEHAEEPVLLHIEADIKGPEAVIREAGLDFGLVQIGNAAKSYVTIENISSLPLTWNLNCLSEKDLFKFIPSGSLQPLETKQIEIIFVPIEEIILNTQFEIQVENGNNLLFNCHGQSQRPKASFLQSMITLEDIYLDVEHVIIAKLINHSVLEAEFRWGKHEGSDANDCEIEIEPGFGLMKSKSVVDCKLRIRVFKNGEITDLRIPCYVQNMPEPIFLDIKGFVKGVSVEYLISDIGQNVEPTKLTLGSSFIDFGNVKVGQKALKVFYIKNTSGIRTKVLLDIKNFKAIEVSETNKSLFIDPLKKVAKIEDRFKLNDNIQGIGFGLEVSSFELPPFETCFIALIAIPEIWGVYNDNLTIKIDGLYEDHFIPIQINVTDSPLKLYTGKIIENESEEISMIRFGSQIQGSGLINRKLKIQNTSYIPIDIDWKIFIIEKNDERLIDLNMVFQDINETELLAQYDNMNTSRTNNRNPAENLNEENLNKSSENRMILRESATTLDYYENGYIYVDRVPVIKINLTNHYGSEVNEENKVFILNKDQLSLKPREKVNMDIAFNTSIKTCRSYEAIFVGYIKIPDNLVEGPGFKRAVGFDKEPIKFKATCVLEAPGLTVEYDDELHFDAAIGDLIISDNNFAIEKIFRNHFYLLNSSLAPIEFDLRINQPFYFNDFESSTQRYQLKPKTKHKVDVLFKFDSNLVESVKFSNNTHSAMLNDSICINFSEGLQQPVPISAKIYAPELKVTKNRIDFGMCLVGQERCQQFAIRNPSCSSVIFNIRIENDPLSLFRSDAITGFLEANKLFINKEEKLINVFFTARHDEKYNAKLIITPMPSIGSSEIEIDLIGSGSYDQRLEAILNV